MNLKAELFIKLSNDNDSNVRAAIAKNHNTPKDILEILVKEKESSIYNAAKENLRSRKSLTEHEEDQKKILNKLKPLKSKIDDFDLL